MSYLLGFYAVSSSAPANAHLIKSLLPWLLCCHTTLTLLGLLRLIPYFILIRFFYSHNTWNNAITLGLIVLAHYSSYLYIFLMFFYPFSFVSTTTYTQLIPHFSVQAHNHLLNHSQVDPISFWMSLSGFSIGTL